MTLTMPIEALLRLQEALDSAMSRDWLGGGTSTSGVFPAVNVFQRGDDFVVVSELPGVGRAELKLEIKKNQLRLAGTRHPGQPEGSSVHRRERSGGDFDRTIAIPAAVDPEAARARYRHGLLVVELPRAAADRPRSIEVD